MNSACCPLYREDIEPTREAAVAPRATTPLKLILLAPAPVLPEPAMVQLLAADPAVEPTPSSRPSWQLALAVTATVAAVTFGILSGIALDGVNRDSVLSAQPAGLVAEGAVPAAEHLVAWLDSDQAGAAATRTLIASVSR
jgi:hypothetical protein